MAGHGWMRRAAALIAVAALSSTLTFALTRSMDANARLQAEVVSAHIRSLLADSPIQIASSDQHTVKPWFNGRIDFAPEVKDLAAEGFALAGGRLDYVGGRRVGSLVYKRRLHVVNVFMWPAATGEPAAPRFAASNGFNTAQWSRNGVVYWAISDLNAGELQQLPSLM